jgi:manganese/zinc/iron transport system permease protein
MIPPFDWQRIVIAPWTAELSTWGWVALMGFLVALSCGVLGNFLVLRRMSLVGDAISHSILPGIAIAFLLTDSRSPLVMFAGALGAGLVTAALIEIIQRNSRIKQDAAMGIVFSTMFALGVLIITRYAGKVDLDADCVLFGELAFVSMEGDPGAAGWLAAVPTPVAIMAVVCLLVLALVVVFYKELLVTTFDPALASTLGMRPALVHYALMAALSVVVVSAFRAVGAILVVAMLILPGATAYLLARRLPVMLLLSALHAALCAVVGMHIGLWLNVSIAAAMAVVGAGLLALAWLCSFIAKARGALAMGSTGAS